MHRNSTNNILRWCLVSAGLLSSAAMADAMTGSNAFVCTGLSAARCQLDTGTCEVKAPWDLNLPDFLKLDLAAKRTGTTEASGHERYTTFRTMERANGLIVLQGVDGERAFSWMITEATGEGTMTISSPAAGLTVFTVCTPIDKL
jgi:hypothetical protein